MLTQPIPEGSNKAIQGSSACGSDYILTLRAKIQDGQPLVNSGLVDSKGQLSIGTEKRACY